MLYDIQLDPASDEEANKRVKAKQIITAKEDGLKAPWPKACVFLNPPGGKLGNKSLAMLFWQRLMAERQTGNLRHAIFIAFSLEHLQTTQKPYSTSIGEFMFCVPKKRIAFDKPNGEKGPSPSHSNCIVYVPGSIDHSEIFIEQFQSLGVIVNKKR